MYIRFQLRADSNIYNFKILFVTSKYRLSYEINIYLEKCSYKLIIFHFGERAILNDALIIATTNSNLL